MRRSMLTKDWDVSDTWYSVNAPTELPDSYRIEMDQWCDTHCKYYFILGGAPFSWKWHFSNTEDYVLFILTWGHYFDEAT